MLRSKIMIIVSLACLAGCSSTPPPQLYFIDDTAPITAKTQALTTSSTFGVYEVVLPTYAQGVKLVKVSDLHTLEQVEDHRWAEPPEEALGTAMGRALARKMDDYVILRPYPRSVKPANQVKIIYDRFVLGAGGEAQFSGQFLIFGDDPNTALRMKRFDYKIQTNGAGYSDYIEAVKTGLENLAQDITNEVSPGMRF